PTARAELRMAIAGPLASLAIALVCLGAYRIGADAQGAAPWLSVLHYLAFINGLLAAFNLIPAFPLDRGRVLRAALWHWKGNYRRSTQVTSRTGSLFGALMATFGVIVFLTGNLVGGLWWFLIGLFLRRAAVASYEQVLVR